ncbi:terpenoid synthase [Ganoderma leucocontextum]|nr:terpenoid synthase [Ganoderma leucocontextum]
MASHIDSPDEGPPLGYLRIPDMLADWPWQRKINPLYQEVATESDAWLQSFLPFNPKSQHAFETIKCGLVAGLLYPDVSRDQLRTCADLQNIFFLIDEYTDVEAAPMVCEMIGACIDALHNRSKPRPHGEVILGEVVRQFWERGQRTVPHQTGKPFVASFTDYLHSVRAEREACDSGGVLTTDAYLAIRQDNIGVPTLSVLGGLFLLVPDHMYDNPLLTRMTRLVSEIIIIDNDIVSYNREQATGVGDFNIVTTTMHHHNLNLNDAVRSLVERNAQLDAQYLQFHREFCSILERHGDADEASRIRRYLAHMGNLRRAHWCWSFECGRYFGERGSTYAKTQMVPLIPKDIRDKSLRGNQIDILLMEEELAKL